MTSVWLRLAVVTAVLAAAAVGPAGAQSLPRIALIIDDLGYRRSEGLRALHLPGAVAVAVLPHATHSVALARAADERGKEVLLHLPMQAVDAAVDPGPGVLEISQSRGEFAAVFAADLAAVPFARAVNNHMGSLLTGHPEHMLWLMEELRSRAPLFFVDSYTTAASVGLETAQVSGVRALRRDVFLDADPAPAAIEVEWQRLLELARRRGSAVGIGHPHAATLELLERELPLLRERGFDLVSLEALLPSAPMTAP